MRWNLLIFGAGLLIIFSIVVAFAIMLLNDPALIEGNEEMVVVGIFGLLTSTAGFVGGYATGVMQALTAPSDPAPTITEKAALKFAGKDAGDD